MKKLSEELVRRVVNNVRMFDHETCTIGGLVIGLEDDLAEAGDTLHRDVVAESGIRAIGETARQLRHQVMQMHATLVRIAAEEEIEVPTERVVNTPPGK